MEVGAAFQRCRLAQGCWKGEGQGQGPRQGQDEDEEREGQARRGREVLGSVGQQPNSMSKDRYLDWVCAAGCFAELGLRVGWGLLHDEISLLNSSLTALVGPLGHSLQQVRAKHPDLLLLPLSSGSCFWQLRVEDCWLAMSLYAINWLAGFPGLAQGQPLANGQEAVKHLKRQVAGFLSRHSNFAVTVESVLAEMAKTTISYCGEEVLPLLPLSVAQMEPGLPAYGHGGQIDSMQFVSGHTKLLLANPAECILPVANRESGPTQAKVRVRPGEELAVCQQFLSFRDWSTGLSWSGMDLGRRLAAPEASPLAVPILVISYFNGIGGAFRAYDLCGLRPPGLISIEIDKHANRVTRKAWPATIFVNDIHDVTVDMVESWASVFPGTQEVHVWGGFPCIHLSSARAFRQSLEGEGSNLSWVLRENLGWIQHIFGSFAAVRWTFENVASMDAHARDEISAGLEVWPFRLDSADVMCFSGHDWCGHQRSLQPQRMSGFMSKTG